MWCSFQVLDFIHPGARSFGLADVPGTLCLVSGGKQSICTVVQLGTLINAGPAGSDLRHGLPGRRHVSPLRRVSIQGIRCAVFSLARPESQRRDRKFPQVRSQIPKPENLRRELQLRVSEQQPRNLKDLEQNPAQGPKSLLSGAKNLLTDHKERLITAANEGFSPQNRPGIGYSTSTSMTGTFFNIHMVFYAFQTDILANTRVNKQLQIKFSPKSASESV